MKLHVHKDLEEVLDAELLPNGWFTVMILEEPKVGPNWAKVNTPTEEGARDELILKTEVVSEVDNWNHRPLDIKLPIPKPEDASSLNKMGQTREDQYLGWLANFSKAFNNLSKVEGDEIEFRPNTMAEVEVITIETKKGARFNGVQPWSNPRAVGREDSKAKDSADDPPF